MYAYSNPTIYIDFTGNAPVGVYYKDDSGSEQYIKPEFESLPPVLQRIYYPTRSYFQTPLIGKLSAFDIATFAGSLAGAPGGFGINTPKASVSPSLRINLMPKVKPASPATVRTPVVSTQKVAVKPTAAKPQQSQTRAKVTTESSSATTQAAAKPIAGSPADPPFTKRTVDGSLQATEGHPTHKPGQFVKDPAKTLNKAKNTSGMTEAEVKAARQRGVDRAKADERKLVQSGHAGTADDGGYSFSERKIIAETGQYPDDIRWHHINDVKRNPRLAEQPDNVMPSRGGTKGHVEKYHPKGTQQGSSGDMLNRQQLQKEHLNGGRATDGTN
jgi:hypothetical protein